jgi:hypothetical protein
MKETTCVWHWGPSANRRPVFTPSPSSQARGLIGKACFLFSLGFPAILRPVVAKVYIVSFRTHNDRRPSKFIVLADNMRSAIKMAWEHGGTDFQSRFDKSTAQAEEMKEGALCVL